MISLSKLKNSIYIRPGSLPLVTQLRDEVKLKGLLPDLKLNCATPSTVNFVNSPRELLKKTFISILLLIMEAEDDYVEARLFYYRKLQT